MGINDFNRVLLMEDIVKGDDAYFVATGVTDGELLRGVQYKGNIQQHIQLLYTAKQGQFGLLKDNMA